MPARSGKQLKRRMYDSKNLSEDDMTNVTELIDSYIQMWNETDAERRRKLIEQIWTEAASYVDPMMQAEGHAGIDAMVQGVQDGFPGYRFRRTSEVDAHHTCVRFTWELGPE